MVRSGARSSSAQRAGGVAVEHRRRHQADQLGPAIGARAATGRRPRPGPTGRVDQVHRHLHRVADGQAQRPHRRRRGPRAATRRASARSGRRSHTL